MDICEVIVEIFLSWTCFRSLTATFSGKIEFSVVSAYGEKVFRKKKSIKESDTQIVQQSDQAAAAMVCIIINCKKLIFKIFIFRKNQSQRVKSGRNTSEISALQTKYIKSHHSVLCI